MGWQLAEPFQASARLGESGVVILSANLRKRKTKKTKTSCKEKPRPGFCAWKCVKALHKMISQHAEAPFALICS